MAGVGIVALAALILAFFALADDDEATVVANATPTPTVVAQVTPTPVPGVAPDPAVTAPTPAPTVPAQPLESEPDSWPEGVTAWTIVLASESGETKARARAQALSARGVEVGVLRSDDFKSLRPGRWIVFSGRYEASRGAQRARRNLGGVAKKAPVMRIEPR